MGEREERREQGAEPARRGGIHQGRDRKGDPHRRPTPRPVSCNTASCPPCKSSWRKKKSWPRQRRNPACFVTSVTEEEIANIVARWTGIPVSKLVEGEREKLLRLPDTLHQRVIGQDEAVQKVSDAILRSRAGIANPNRPIGSASCSSAPPASARPSWPRRWRRPCLTTRRTWSVST